MSGFMKLKKALEVGNSRVVVVPAQITLEQVHEVIQELFDWGRCHLWEFEDAFGRIFSPDDGDLGWGRERKMLPPEEYCLCDLLPERGAKLKYTYDFGDNWRHVLTRMVDPKEHEIKCIKTTGVDGLEDVGGIWGLDESKDECHSPTVEELTERLLALDLTPHPEKQGKIKQAQTMLLKKIRALSPYDWEQLVELGETGLATPKILSWQFETLVNDLPAVRSFCFGYQNSFHADREFKKFWKANKDMWFAARQQ